MRTLIALLRDRSAATAIEYALVGGIMSITCVAALNLLGINVSNLYTKILSAVQAASG